jgi:hypothetical protein
MAVEFTIEGLNAQQRVLADIIWACDTKDRVDAFIAALPTKALRNEAKSIVDLMIMAVVEQCYDGINPNMEQAQSVLQKYNKKKG